MEIKKIWIDIEEPKTAIMFYSLIKKFQEHTNLRLLITARDYDSTYKILDDHDIKYEKIGRHGGAKLASKLKAYIDRLDLLFPLVKDFSPDYFVTFSSVEGARISYGLGIPSIGYNDEPRNVHVCKLLFPYIDKIIVPQCIPKEDYVKLHADPNKLIDYNGIDEVAWLSEYTPNPNILKNSNLNLKKGKYIIIRTEPSFASYLTEKLDERETKIAQFFPRLYESFPDFHYFLLVRTQEQEEFLKNNISHYIKEPNVILTRYLPNLVDLCFYSALVISGGGTIVRESSFLMVPSIEFFPGKTAPQEEFLIKGGFPLKHIKDNEGILKEVERILIDKKYFDRSILSIREKIRKYENPNDICYDIVSKELKKL